MLRSRTYIAIPPGESIKEQLEIRNMQQKEFAVRMGMSEKHISKLVNGEVQLTMDVARRLEMVLGVPAQFWCNLEAIYRETIIKVNEENAMEADVTIANQFPYKEMAKHGWVPDTKKWTERVINLRKHFEVARLDLLQESLMPAVARPKASDPEKENFALIAWAQKAKLEARGIETQPVNMEIFRRQIERIRQMITMDQILSHEKIVEPLAECGVAVVFLPHIGNRVWHGATFLDGNKIVLGLTTDEQDTAKQWLHLFHEFAHIEYRHIDHPGSMTKADEACANEYARRMLDGYVQYGV